MTMIITFMMFAIVSCIIMIIALAIKASKADKNKAVPSDEVAFIISMVIGCFIPVINLLASTRYLIKAIRK